MEYAEIHIPDMSPIEFNLLDKFARISLIRSTSLDAGAQVWSHARALPANGRRHLLGHRILATCLPSYLILQEAGLGTVSLNQLTFGTEMTWRVLFP
jgi:hypothetical protein